jgi:hypothetical protein
MKGLKSGNDFESTASLNIREEVIFRGKGTRGLKSTELETVVIPEN